MANRDKILKAIEIFKSEFPEVRGKFAAHASGNVVEILLDGSRYCMINVSTGNVRAV